MAVNTVPVSIPYGNRTVPCHVTWRWRPSLHQRATIPTLPTARAATSAPQALAGAANASAYLPYLRYLSCHVIMAAGSGSMRHLPYVPYLPCHVSGIALPPRDVLRRRTVPTVPTCHVSMMAPPPCITPYHTYLTTPPRQQVHLASRRGALPYLPYLPCVRRRPPLRAHHSDSHSRILHVFVA